VNIGGHSLALTNLDKVYWPATGYTKCDLMPITGPWPTTCCPTSKTGRSPAPAPQRHPRRRVLPARHPQPTPGMGGNRRNLR
jgi:hypothetical protein